MRPKFLSVRAMTAPKLYSRTRAVRGQWPRSPRPPPLRLCRDYSLRGTCPTTDGTGRPAASPQAPPPRPLRQASSPVPQPAPGGNPCRLHRSPAGRSASRHPPPSGREVAARPRPRPLSGTARRRRWRPPR